MGSMKVPAVRCIHHLVRLYEILHVINYRASTKRCSGGATELDLCTHVRPCLDAQVITDDQRASCATAALTVFSKMTPLNRPE